MAVKRELSRTEGEAALETLVAAYERNLDHLRSPTYNEQELRLNFINPFWRCLGWPVGEQGHLPPERVDVRIEIDSQGKRPDYQFQPDGVVRFFCEAKRPSEKLAKPSYAFQAKSYAWSFNRKSRSAPFVVLTNFDHFRFFKADVMPALERPDEGLISDFDLTYEDYVGRFDLLWNTFSRDQVVSGSLDQFIDYDALHLKALDREFLRSLLAWRKSLAETILGANRSLKRHELNEAVQRILDRIVFIRMIADKGAEPITSLSAVAKAADPFRALVTLSRRLEPDYNGLIFKPHFSDELRVEGKAITAIIQALDPEHSPYRFDAVSIELLGRIYEAFLGHQIEINSDGKTCRVEPKPELLKSGGVYYTPEFVVDYVVRKALDPLVEGMTPDRLRGLRVLDPACGSGSFLIGAFEYLIKHHEHWYNNRATQVVRPNSMYKSDVDVAADGHLSVSLSKRAQILRDNIFGVDIDNTATEVAALSLYLKLLEGSANTTKQLALFAHGTILPDLSGNLKCGNSLIDPSTGDTAWIPGLDEEEQRRVNPFAWRDEFRGVFKEGGFSAIIGNPPYVKEYVNKQIFDDVRGTRLKKYCAGKMDIWYVFACVAIDLLRNGGYHSFITQNNWVTSHSAQKLRSKIRAETIVVDFFDFHDYMVFENASIQTMIYTLRKHRTVREDPRGRDGAEVAPAPQPPYSVSYRRLEQAGLSERTVEWLMYSKRDPRVLSLRVEVDPSEGGGVLAFAEEDVAQVLAKIKKRGAFSIRKDEVGQGIIGGPDDAFLFPPEERFTTAERPLLHKHYTTSNRFAAGDSSSLIAYSTRDNLEKMDAREYPHFSSQIAKYKTELSGRREVKKGMIKYFHLHWPRDERLFRAGPKLACATRVRKPSFYYAEEPYYASRAVNMLVTDRIDLKLLNGILNSSVVHFWLLKRGKRLGSMLQIDTSFLLSVPIPAVMSTDAADIVKLVDVLLRNHAALRRSKTTVDKNRFERAAATAEVKLDAIVYRVFGLPDADIAVIERELNTEPDVEKNREEGVDMEEPGSAEE